MSRLDARFAALKSTGRAGLVTFVMGGDPGREECAALLAALPQAGADVIEIGMPFSDPMADGPVIEAAGGRALAAGMTLPDILELVRGFRTRDNDTPLILMGYYNPLYRYGPARFCADAAQAGADGVILVDLPPEEEGEFLPHAKHAGLSLIRLVAPTSLETRLPLLMKEAEGFVYYISVAGITGGKTAESADLTQALAAIRAHTALPVAVGFGIKTPAQAAAVARAGAEAVVVGSALVDTLAKEGREAALSLVRAMREKMG